jgi:hypothetical protein
MTNYATITLVLQSVWASTMLGLGTGILPMVVLMDPYSWTLANKNDQRTGALKTFAAYFAAYKPSTRSDTLI